MSSAFRSLGPKSSHVFWATALGVTARSQFPKARERGGQVPENGEEVLKNPAG